MQEAQHDAAKITLCSDLGFAVKDSSSLEKQDGKDLIFS